MDPLPSAAQFLEAFGPYAIVVFLGWAYWQKDKQIHELHERVLSMAEEQTETSAKMESALNGLKEVIRTVLDKI